MNITHLFSEYTLNGNEYTLIWFLNKIPTERLSLLDSTRTLNEIKELQYYQKIIFNHPRHFFGQFTGQIPSIFKLHVHIKIIYNNKLY